MNFVVDVNRTMAEIEFGGHTVRSHGAKVAKTHKYDWLIVLVLVAMDGFLNYIQPFNRYTNAKMLEDLKYPFKMHDTIPMWAVPVCIYLLLPLYLSYHISYQKSMLLHIVGKSIIINFNL